MYLLGKRQRKKKVHPSSTTPFFSQGRREVNWSLVQPAPQSSVKLLHLTHLFYTHFVLGFYGDLIFFSAWESQQIYSNAYIIKHVVHWLIRFFITLFLIGIKVGVVFFFFGNTVFKAMNCGHLMLPKPKGLTWRIQSNLIPFITFCLMAVIGFLVILHNQYLIM